VKELSGDDLAILQAFAAVYTDSHGCKPLSVSALAARTGLHISRVLGAAREMESAGLLVTTKRLGWLPGTLCVPSGMAIAAVRALSRPLRERRGADGRDHVTGPGGGRDPDIIVPPPQAADPGPRSPDA
jgi:hypothetical protein